MYLLPLDFDFERINIDSGKLGGYFQGTFNVDVVVGTFFDIGGYQRATVYVNGHNIGRIISLSLQKHLYCPEQFLVSGENSIVILDLETSVPFNVLSRDKGDD